MNDANGWVVSFLYHLYINRSAVLWRCYLMYCQLYHHPLCMFLFKWIVRALGPILLISLIIWPLVWSESVPWKLVRLCMMALAARLSCVFSLIAQHDSVCGTCRTRKCHLLNVRCRLQAPLQQPCPCFHISVHCNVFSIYCSAMHESVELWFHYTPRGSEFIIFHCVLRKAPSRLN